MCEQFVARSSRLFRIDELWPLTERLKRFGVAGFGWGAPWLDADGRIASYRSVKAFAEDPARERVGALDTPSLLVHLRRPSKLSTRTLPDAQPFVDPSGRFAFGHNGDLRDYAPWRKRYLAEGRIQGRADTEPGARWLEDAWQPDGVGQAAAAGATSVEGQLDGQFADVVPVPRLLRSLHDTFGGSANMAVLSADGNAYHYSGYQDNRIFSFCLGPIRLASTGIFSSDRPLFRYVAPGASSRHLIRYRTTVELEPG